jgi:hypothetical protein
MCIYIYLLKEWWIFFCLVQFTSLNRGVNRHWAWHFLTQPGPQLADVNIGVSGLVYGENMGKNNVNNGVVCWKKNFCFNMVLITCYCNIL